MSAVHGASSAAADARMAATRSVWRYLPQVFAYPLRGYALPVLLLGTPIVWLILYTLEALLMQDARGLIRALVTVAGAAIGGTWLLAYTLRVIERSAAGHALPPPMSADTMFDGGLWFLRALPYPAVLASLYVALAPRAPVATQALLLLGGLLWPAHALTLATDGRALAAVNPLRLLRVVYDSGALYALVCVTLAGAGWLLMAQAAKLYGIAFCALALYALIAVCHLLGYTAFRRHEALGLDVETQDPQRAALEREQAQRLEGVLARTEAELLRGDPQGALRELLAEPGGPANLRRFHEDLFARLLLRVNVPLALAQGQRLITYLLQDKRAAAALSVYETCIGKYSHFEPETPLQVEQLAQAALDGGYDTLFLRLLEKLERRYPGDAIEVSGGLMLARYWCERRSDDARARDILQPLLARTQHPMHARVVALARVLERG